MTRIGFAMAAVLLGASAVQARLEIGSIQAVYGALGPERKSLDVHPNDEIVFRFTVSGARVDADGRVDATIAMKLVDANGDILLVQDNPLKVALTLGGDSFPAHARIGLGERVAPGEYTLTVTILDKLSLEKASFQRKINCVPTEFALVAPEFFYDPEGKVPAPAGGSVGQVLHFRARAIGLDRSQNKIESALAVEILDAAGKDTLAKPVTAETKNDDAEVVRKINSITYRAHFLLNRPGEFTLRVSVTDRIAGKTATFEAPLKVTAP
jgi:hypothetical protein